MTPGNQSSLKNLLHSPSTASVAGLAFLGVMLCYLFAQQPPVGTVKGRVVMTENRHALENARVNLSPVGYVNGAARREGTRHAKSSKDGSFTVNRVPAGDYILTAESESHSTATDKAVYVTVEEGRITPINVEVARSLPEFGLHQGQVIFGTTEKPKLGLTGYVDVKKAPGKDSLHVAIWKTKLSNLLRDPAAEEALDSVGRTYNHVKEVPAHLLKPDSGNPPRQVMNLDTAITEADNEGFFHKRYVFDRLPPGLYLVGVSHAGLTDCTWMMVTDTALVEKRAKNQIMDYVVDMKTGTPVPQTEVRAYRNGNVIARSQTNGSGLAELILPDQPSKRHKHASAVDPGDDSGDSGDIGDAPAQDDAKTRITTVVVRGDDEAVINKDYYRNEDAGGFVVHAYTDRPIYRPGQHIFFKDIVRAADTSGVGGYHYTTPVGTPVHVELRDPSGEKLMSVSGKTSADGCYWGQTDLDAEAPTGVYSLITSVSGEQHTHDIVIASYKKPEYTVTVTPDKPRYTRGETVSMTISASYYFGAPVVGAKVTYTVSRDHDYETPDEDADNEADDPGDWADAGANQESFGGDGDRYSFFGADVTSGKTQLNENGKAVITFKADSPQDPEGPQKDKYTLSATVIEGEDNEVEADGSAHVTTGDFDLDVRAEGSLASPGQPDSLIITARDADGHPVPNLAVEVEAGYHHWSDGEYSYESLPTNKTTLNSDGTGIFNLIAPRAGEMMVKVRAWDSHHHKIVARTYIWVASDVGGDIDTQFDDLSLHTDKRRYSPGETARVLVNAVRTGETVLVTIEGDRIYHTQLVVMSGRSTVVHVPILADYGPNVYMDACYVRDKKFATTETPWRVTSPRAQLNVSITADRDANNKQQGLAKYQPEEKITYHIRTTDDQNKPIPAELSFGVVDEAIYALKKDPPNALRDDFYPRRSNLVQTEYSFAIAFMGDADKSEPEIVARKKFPDTAYWNPDIKTNGNGDATVTFTLPDNLTTWRATATGVTLDTRVGRVTQQVMVTKDFLVRLEAPRFLTQKDKSRLVTVVHNDTGSAQSITVKLELSNLALQGPNVQTVTLDPGKISQMIWPVDAVTVGDADITVKAWTAKGAGGQQFTDGVENKLPILPHGRETVAAHAGAVNGDRPQVETVRLEADAASGSGRLTIRVTPSIVGALLGASDYLIGYPYGCTEQTMSRFLPDLLVERAIKSGGLSGVTIPNADKIPKMVRNSILRLTRFQHEKTGAWGWWEHDDDDPWMTAYVLLGLSEAKADGYMVNDRLMQRGRQAAVNMLADKRLTNDTKLFVMYGLAMAGNTDVPRRVSSNLRLKDLNTESIGYLALLDKKLGVSPSMPMAELEKRSVFGDSMIHWDTGHGLYYWDWDDLGATSVALRAITAFDKNDPRIEPILRWLMYHRTGEYWGNTRDTAWALMGFCDYLSAHGSGVAGGEVRVSLNGAPLQTVALTPETLHEKEIIIRAPVASIKPGDNRITLERVGGTTPIFYSVEMKQVVDAEDMKAIAPVMAVTSHLQSEPKHTSVKGGDPANQLVISRVYERIVAHHSSTYDWSLQTEATNNQLNEGDRVRVRLTITAPREMNYVLIEDPFPAGCEVTERGDADEIVDWGYWYSSIDIRDSKIAFFARSLPKGQSVIEYNMRAKTHGSYHAMPTLLQGMYSPDMHAESAEDRVMIR